MRTALDIIGDVLSAAKEIAWRAFARQVAGARPDRQQLLKAPKATDRLAAYGIHPLPPRGGIVSNELVDRIRGEEGV